jgi:hypothetical protein
MWSQRSLTAELRYAGAARCGKLPNPPFADLRDSRPREKDMKRSVAVSLGLGLYFLAISVVSARPAKNSDFDGKTVCWQDGTIEKYATDGKYSNMTDGPGTYHIDDKGRISWKLEKYGVTFTGDEQINDDGTITYTGSAPGTDNVTVSGEFCNK